MTRIRFLYEGNVFLGQGGCCFDAEPIRYGDRSLSPVLHQLTTALSVHSMWHEEIVGHRFVADVRHHQCMVSERCLECLPAMNFSSVPPGEKLLDVS